MQKYLVTATAGVLVAGMKSPGVGKLIKLSDEQAAHPLRLGHIEMPEKKKKAAPAPKTEAPEKVGQSEESKKDK